MCIITKSFLIHFIYIFETDTYINCQNSRNSHSIIRILGIEADLCSDTQSCQNDDDCQIEGHRCNCSLFCGPICTDIQQAYPGRYYYWVVINIRFLVVNSEPGHIYLSNRFPNNNPIVYRRYLLVLIGATSCACS